MKKKTQTNRKTPKPASKRPGIRRDPSAKKKPATRSSKMKQALLAQRQTPWEETRGRPRVKRAPWNPRTFKTLRQLSGWGVAAMAKQLGISRSQAYALQSHNPQDAPSLDLAASVAELLDVEPEVLSQEIDGVSFTVAPVGKSKKRESA